MQAWFAWKPQTVLLDVDYYSPCVCSHTVGITDEALISGLSLFGARDSKETSRPLRKTIGYFRCVELHDTLPHEREKYIRTFTDRIQRGMRIDRDLLIHEPGTL